MQESKGVSERGRKVCISCADRAVTYSKLGDALVYCCDAVKCADVIRGLWEKTDHDLCISEEEIPEAYYRT